MLLFFYGYKKEQRRGNAWATGRQKEGRQGILHDGPGSASGGGPEGRGETLGEEEEILVIPCLLKRLCYNELMAGDMTNTQLFLSIGIPSVLALINLAVILALFTSLGNQLAEVRSDIKSLTGAVNELDKRLTRVEIKLGIQS